MRFRYFCIAGILAATTPADSTSTRSKSAALREEGSSQFDRDGIAAIEASVNDEDRAGPNQANGMTVARFFKEVLLKKPGSHNTIFDGWSKKYNTMVNQEVTPQKLYEAIASDVSDAMLISPMWGRWLFFTSKYCAHHRKNPHEYIIEVLSNFHGAGRLSEILIVAAGIPLLSNFVKKLQEVQISSWLEKQYSLRHVFCLLQVNDVWDNSIFMSPRFITWTRYLHRVRKTDYENYPVYTEILGLWEFIDFDTLLMMPMLPTNAYLFESAQYLQVFKSIGLYQVAFPYQFVSMLIKGLEKDDEKFTLLFMYEPTRDFWMNYVEKFNEQYPELTASLCETLKSIFDLPELFTMLHAAVNSPNHGRSHMALWFLEVQFSEWKTSRVTDIAGIMPDRTYIPSEIPPVITVTWQAYIKYLREIRPSKADFLM